MKTVTLKGQPLQLKGAFPSIGSLSPPVVGVDRDLQEKSLADFAQKKKIICFVPSLDTSVCSISAQRFNKELRAHKEVALIYCSMDLPFAVQRLCVADAALYDHVMFLSLFRHPSTAEGFGVKVGSGPLAGLCARAVFVLDAENRLLYTELVPEITQEPHYGAAVAALQRSPSLS